MYHEEKEKARNLRKVNGFSIKDISKKLGIAKSTISLWVRDIELSEEQIFKLREKSKSNFFLTGLKNPNYIFFRERRKLYQESGKNLILNCDKNFIAGLMLFWGEGSKSKNMVTLSNGDPELLKFFVNFLKKYFNVKNEDITFRFQWYSGNGISQEKVEDFWLKKLKIEKFCMRKCYIDYRPIKNMGKKIGKCLYGIGCVRVCNTEIVHKIYGAIQEFVGFERPEWLF